MLPGSIVKNQNTGESPFTLRRSVTADKPIIEALFLEMLREIYGTQDVDGYEAGYLDKFYADTGDWICVSESAGSVTGYLSIEVHREVDPPFIYLDDFCVTKADRGKGIGKAMLYEAERFAISQGINAIVLHVEQANEKALRLYTHLGYKVVAEEGSRLRMMLALKP